MSQPSEESTESPSLVVIEASGGSCNAATGVCDVPPRAVSAVADEEHGDEENGDAPTDTSERAQTS